MNRGATFLFLLMLAAGIDGCQTAVPAPSPQITAISVPNSATVSPTTASAVTAAPVSTLEARAVEINPTATSSPGSAPTATFSRPNTLVPSTPQKCSIPVDGQFVDSWLANSVFAMLGCPTNQAHKTESAEEPFQRGLMVWRKDTGLIYIRWDSTWYKFADTFKESDPEYTCGKHVSPPSPRRGFSKIWCSGDWQAKLGNALDWEWGFCMGNLPCEVFQDFEHGFIYYSRFSKDNVVVVFSD